MRNRKFKQDNQAVSAVISTILMVAITVVLAATAFVLVADIGNKAAETAPLIGLRSDDVLDRLVIVSSSEGANWNRMGIKLNSDTGTGAIYMGASMSGGYQNEGASTTGANILNQVQVADVDMPITANDYLEFCRDPLGSPGGITVTVIDTVARTVLSDYPVDSIAAC